MCDDYIMSCMHVAVRLWLHVDTITSVQCIHTIYNITIIISHRLPDRVRTNVFVYRSAINSHNNAIIMPYVWYIAALLQNKSFVLTPFGSR